MLTIFIKLVTWLHLLICFFSPAKAIVSLVVFHLYTENLSPNKTLLKIGYSIIFQYYSMSHFYFVYRQITESFQITTICTKDYNKLTLI